MGPSTLLGVFGLLSFATFAHPSCDSPLTSHLSSFHIIFQPPFLMHPCPFWHVSLAPAFALQTDSLEGVKLLRIITFTFARSGFLYFLLFLTQEHEQES